MQHRGSDILTPARHRCIHWKGSRCNVYDFNTPLDNQKPVISKAVAVIFGGILVALSALTSAAFFFRYAADAFTFLAGDLSPWISAAVGVICYEGAALTWAWLRSNDADTGQQLAVANVAAWGATIGGLCVTCVFFALNSDLIRLDATAETAVSLVGGLLIILGIGGNFAAGHIYRIGAASHTANSQQAEIRAMQNAAAFTANREATYAALQQTLDAIRRDLPTQAVAQGKADADTYLRQRFTYQNEEAAPVPFQANGQK